MRTATIALAVFIYGCGGGSDDPSSTTVNQSPLFDFVPPTAVNTDNLPISEFSAAADRNFVPPNACEDWKYSSGSLESYDHNSNNVMLATNSGCISSWDVDQTDFGVDNGCAEQKLWTIHSRGDSYSYSISVNGFVYSELYSYADGNTFFFEGGPPNSEQCDSVLADNGFDSCATVYQQVVDQINAEPILLNTTLHESHYWNETTNGFSIYHEKGVCKSSL